MGEDVVSEERWKCRQWWQGPSPSNVPVGTSSRIRWWDYMCGVWSSVWVTFQGWIHKLRLKRRWHFIHLSPNLPSPEFHPWLVWVEDSCNWDRSGCVAAGRSSWSDFCQLCSVEGIETRIGSGRVFYFSWCGWIGLECKYVSGSTSAMSMLRGQAVFTPIPPVQMCSFPRRSRRLYLLDYE